MWWFTRESPGQKWSCRSRAKFDAIVAEVRRELSYSYEGLQVPPPRWEDEAYLSDQDKQLILLAGVDPEAICNFPYHQVALNDFVVAGQDADFPLSERQSHIFANSVRSADVAFDRLYKDREWHPQVARLIVELKLASPVADNHATRIDLLSPLCDVLEARLLLPPLPGPIDIETIDPVHRDYALEVSLFLAAEIQLHRPLPEEEAVYRIRKCFPQCPATLIGNRVRLAKASPCQHQIRFRVRQF